jgi:hypothetical protein
MPASIDPMRNNVMAVRYRSRRPYRSDKRPHSGTDAVDVRRYAENTQL